ncbi:MAG: hypothetical protein IKJ01_08990 [Lachnospiraceae bacterium]|nr:hypothetical protein [Lachnospiraceae bacterium]
MSLGIGGIGRKVIEDEIYVVYEYAVYNWNHENWKEMMENFDGVITIEKSCFVKPAIHTKLKRQPNGKKKLVTKKIYTDVPFEKLFQQGKIVIENCSHAWRFTQEGYDSIAMKLIYKLFREYRQQETLPQTIEFFQ